MTEQSEVIELNKEKDSKNVWIAAEILDTVLLMIQATRQKQQRQQVQP
jgi:hypothetical protein